MSPDKKPNEQPEEADGAEERLAQLAEQVGKNLPEAPEPPSVDAIHDRLKASERRLAESAKKAGLSEAVPGLPPKKTYHQSTAVGLAVAYNLVGSVVAGWFLGWLIDRVTNGFLAQTIGTLLGTAVGMTTALLIIFKGPGMPRGKKKK